MNKEQALRIKVRKPIEKALKKLEVRYGDRAFLNACRHYVSVRAFEKKTEREIASLQERLSKLKR